MWKFQKELPMEMLPKIIVLSTIAISLQACTDKIDARQAHVEQGLIYKKDASDPFSGSLINVGTTQVGREYGSQFIPYEGSCVVPVKNGMFEGVATCKSPDGKNMAEVAYTQGHQDGTLKVWATDSGNLMVSATVRDGRIQGVMERYNPKSGKIISRINYEAGNKAGEEKLWDITGEKLLTDLTWQNGVQTGVYRYGEREEHFKAGVLDGVRKFCTWTGSRAKYEAYQGMANRLGGTYFFPAMVDQPSDSVCTEEIFKDGVKEVVAAASAAPGLSADACLDAKIAAFRKENGEEAAIIDDVIQEWKAGCKK